MTAPNPSEGVDGEIDLRRTIAAARKAAAASPASLRFEIARQPGLTRLNRLKRWHRRLRRSKLLRRSVALGAVMALNGSDFIDKAYLKVLGRAADPTGLSTYRAWLNGSAASRIKVLQALRHSGEGRARKAQNRWLGLAIWWNKRSLYDIRLVEMLQYQDTEFVANAYGLLLGRQPDASSHALRLGQAQAGRRGKVRMLAELCASPEGRMLHSNVRGLRLAIFRWDFRYSLVLLVRPVFTFFGKFRVRLSRLLRLDGTEFMEAAYATMLGRPGDSGDRDGMATYLGWLNGTSAAKIRVLQSLRRSDEGRTRRLRGLMLEVALRWNRRSIYNMRLDDVLACEDEVFVANAYRNLLGREPDADSIALRMAQAQAGRSGRVRMLAALCASPEGHVVHARVRGLGFAVLGENLYHGLAALARRALPSPIRRAILARRRSDALQPRRSEV